MLEGFVLDRNNQLAVPGYQEAFPQALELARTQRDRYQAEIDGIRSGEALTYNVAVFKAHDVDVTHRNGEPLKPVEQKAIRQVQFGAPVEDNHGHAIVERVRAGEYWCGRDADVRTKHSRRACEANGQRLHGKPEGNGSGGRPRFSVHADYGNVATTSRHRKGALSGRGGTARFRGDSGGCGSLLAQVTCSLGHAVASGCEP